MFARQIEGNYQTCCFVRVEPAKRKLCLFMNFRPFIQFLVIACRASLNREDERGREGRSYFHECKQPSKLEWILADGHV